MSCSPIAGDPKPLVSVVIPTKNRSNYARWTIQSSLRLGEQCEVVVADSSSDDSLRDALAELGILDKVTYVRTSPDFSVVDNFNEAISHTRGQYVTCIGDDDIVTPALLDVATYALADGIECVNFSFPITYWWPDFFHRRRGAFDAATIGVAKFSGQRLALDPKRELSAAAEKIGTGPQKMPRIYAGLVSGAVIDRIRGKHQFLFGGVSPDVYSSTLLSSECNSLVYIDYPVIVPGLSGGSTSGTSSNGKHLGKLRENSHIAPFRNLVWDERIPEYYSVPTVWSYSMLKALEAVRLEHKANLFGLHLKCLLYTRGFTASILPSFRKYLRSRPTSGLLRDVAGAVCLEAGFVFGAVKRRVVERFVSSEFARFSSYPDSLAATAKIDQIVSDNPFVAVSTKA